MQTQWKLVTGTTVALLMGASALAYGDDGVTRTFLGTPVGWHQTAADICPPMACTIVMKTERGGPPSEVHRVN